VKNGKPVVLVVEDHGGLQAEYKYRLETIGCEVLQAYDVSQTYEIFESRKDIDIIVTEGCLVHELDTDVFL